MFMSKYFKNVLKKSIHDLLSFIGLLLREFIGNLREPSIMDLIFNMLLLVNLIPFKPPMMLTRSLTQVTDEFRWVQTLLTELQVLFSTYIIYSDNQSTVSLSQSIFSCLHKNKWREICLLKKRLLLNNFLFSIFLFNINNWCSTKPLSIWLLFLRTNSKVNGLSC